MAQTGQLNKQIIVQPSSAVVVTGTSFDAAKNMSVSLPDNITLSLIRIRGTFATTAKVNIQVSRDAAGDDIIIPDTEATLAVGITTASIGVAVYEVEANIYTQGTIYIHAKVDAGTYTWTKTEVYWRQ
tara:strand:+ start:747 stop:1130 length:384 start_codon:yes stop_codon:yes gene_type:complete